MIAGGLIGGVTYCSLQNIFKEEPTIPGLLLSVAGGALAATLPDVLEPAVSGAHRSTLHSVTILVSLGYLTYRAIKYGNIKNDLKVILGVLGTSYASHLALDSLTPRSLPLI